MSAIDFVKGAKALKIKQKKVTGSWNVSGSQLSLDGSPVEGEIVWTRSTYMKKGASLNFYAYVSDVIYICPEVQRADYVPPKEYGWKALGHSGELADEDDDE
jgi:hypothetical protein